MKKAVCILFLLSLTASFVPPLAAEDITFETEVNAPQVALDDSLQLTLRITGTQNVSPIELPAIDGFTSRFIGPATSVSIINGQSSVTKSFIYVLYPQRTGKFTIPAFTLELEGKKYTSAPVEIDVVDQVSSGPQPGGPAHNQRRYK